MNMNQAKERILNLIEQEIDECKIKEQLAEFLFRRFQDESRTDALAIIEEDWTLFGLTPDQLTLAKKECQRLIQGTNEYEAYGDSIREAEIWEVEDDPDDRTIRIRIRDGYENEDGSNINTTYTYTHINDLSH